MATAVGTVMTMATAADRTGQSALFSRLKFQCVNFGVGDIHFSVDFLQ